MESHCQGCEKLPFFPGLFSFFSIKIANFGHDYCNLRTHFSSLLMKYKRHLPSLSARPQFMQQSQFEIPGSLDPALRSIFIVHLALAILEILMHRVDQEDFTQEVQIFCMLFDLFIAERRKDVHKKVCKIIHCRAFTVGHL